MVAHKPVSFSLYTFALTRIDDRVGQNAGAEETGDLHLTPPDAVIRFGNPSETDGSLETSRTLDRVGTLEVWSVPRSALIIGDAIELTKEATMLPEACGCGE